MREDVVIQSEVVAGNDIDTSILLDLPVGKTKPLGLGKEIGLGDLSAPVCGQEVRTGANLRRIQEEEKKKGGDSQASVAFFRSRRTPMRGKPRMADWTILTVGFGI